MARNLLDRLLGRGDDITRSLTLTQYIQQVIQSGLQAYWPPTTYYSPTGQPSERIPNDYESYVTQIYTANPVIFGLMQRRASVFSEARFSWRAVKPGFNPGDVLPVGDGLELLAKPWPNGTTGELLARAIQDVDLGGNFYCVRENDRLRRLRPDWVQIVLSGDPLTEHRVDVLGYVYSPNGPDSGNYDSYLPDEIVHWSPIPDPLALYRGMSWLTPVLRELAADKAATDHRVSHLQNGASLGPVAMPPQGTTLEQFKKFVEAADARHSGPNASGKWIFLAPGSEIKTVASTLQQLDLRALQGAGETRMAVAAGVPAVIAGISEGLQGSSLNAGNYNAAKRAWIDGSLRPLWRSMCAAFGNIIPAPNLSGVEGIEEGVTAELGIHDADIPILADDRQDQAQILNAQMSAINIGITAGFKPKAVVIAVRDNDLSVLEDEHSGAYSVQLQPPGANMGAEGTPGQSPDGTTPAAGAEGGEAPDTEGESEYQRALQELRAGEAQRSQILRARIEHTGAMVALVPADEDAERLVLGDGEPLDELHLTLFYLGDAADIPVKTQGQIREALATMVERRALPAVVGNVFGAALWNPNGDEPAAVLTVGDPQDAPGGLVTVRAMVENAIASAGFEPPEQHSPWAPHVCVRYGAPLSSPALVNRVGPVVFDRLRVAFGGTVLDIPLAEVSRAYGPGSRRPYPGQTWRHGWIPVSPLALLSPEDVDAEYGPELDRFEFNAGQCRIVAREQGVTVESDRGEDIAIHSTPSPADVQRWADAIESGEDYDRPRFSVLWDNDGATVRFGDYEDDYTGDEVAEIGQALRDMSYVVEDAATVPDDEIGEEPEGDETPIPDREGETAYRAALARFRDDLDIERADRYSIRTPAGMRSGKSRGGQFRSLSSAVIGALEAWINGEGDDDPLEQFTQPQLRKAAAQLGVQSDGLSKPRLKLALLEKARDDVRAQRTEATEGRRRMPEGYRVERLDDGRWSVQTEGGPEFAQADTVTEARRLAEADRDRRAAQAGRRRREESRLPGGGPIPPARPRVEPMTVEGEPRKLTDAEKVADALAAGRISESTAIALLTGRRGPEGLDRSTTMPFTTGMVHAGYITELAWTGDRERLEAYLRAQNTSTLRAAAPFFGLSLPADAGHAAVVAAFADRAMQLEAPRRDLPSGEELRQSLMSRKVPDLKASLRAAGLPVSGRKAELVDRLVAAYSAARGGGDDATGGADRAGLPSGRDGRGRGSRAARPQPADREPDAGATRPAAGAVGGGDAGDLTDTGVRAEEWGRTAPRVTPSAKDIETGWSGEPRGQGGHAPGTGRRGKTEPGSDWTPERYEAAIRATIDSPQAAALVARPSGREVSVRAREVDGVIWVVFSDNRSPDGPHGFRHGYPINGPGVVKNTAAGPVPQPYDPSVLTAEYLSGLVRGTIAG